MNGALATAAGWLYFATLSLAIGAAALRVGVIRVAPELDGATRDRLSRGAARVAALASLGLGLSLPALLVRQADELRFPGDPIGEALSLVLRTQWGTFWWWAVGGGLWLIIGALMATATGRRSLSRAGWSLACLALLPLILFPGLTGHANAEEARFLSLSGDALHVAAGGAWVGGLGVLLIVGRGWLAQLVPAFSRMAILSVVVLVASGTYASWHRVGSVSDYWGTTYGRTLTLKVGLFLVVALLGAINWSRLTPSLRSAKGHRAMRRVSTVEFAVGNLVLLVTAILIRMSPGG